MCLRNLTIRSSRARFAVRLNSGVSPSGTSIKMIGRAPQTPQRVRLRPLREDDLDAFHTYRSNPEVARLQGWEPISRQEAADLLKGNASVHGFVPGGWVQLAIAQSQSDRLLGDLGVFLAPDQSTAELGITITPAAQGNGYATEAIGQLLDLLFTSTPVVEVIACTDIRNAPCIGALKRSGMSSTGKRQAEYKGELCTEIIFSIQRPEG